MAEPSEALPPSTLPHLSAPVPALTLGDLDIQGCADQSHEGRIEVDGVVIGNRQIHPQEPLQKTKGKGSHSQAPLPDPVSQTHPTQGAPGRTLKAAARVPPTLRLPVPVFHFLIALGGSLREGTGGSPMLRSPCPFLARLLDPRAGIFRVGPHPCPAPEFFWTAPFHSDPKEEEYKPDRSDV